MKIKDQEASQEDDAVESMLGIQYFCLIVGYLNFQPTKHSKRVNMRHIEKNRFTSAYESKWNSFTKMCVELMLTDQIESSKKVCRCVCVCVSCGSEEVIRRAKRKWLFVWIFRLVFCVLLCSWHTSSHLFKCTKGENGARYFNTIFFFYC